MKNFVFGFLIAVIIGVIGVVAFMAGKNQGRVLPIPTATPKVVLQISPTSPVVGGDKDEHGCIGSAGYTWCEVKNKCLRVWEEPCIINTALDSALIKEALVKKHNWNINEIEVTVSKNDGIYASGGVEEKNSQVGGGYFFAVKDAGIWKIVADGNGTIDCENLVPYPDYPISLIPECYNMKTGKTVKR